MSFETLIWVRTQKTGSPITRSVLRVLADHAGQDQSCYLRTRLIAAETEASESSVRKSLATLVERGLIRVYERYDRTGKRIANRYQLLIDGRETPPPDAEDWADVRQQQTEEDPLPGGGAPSCGGGSTLSHTEGLPDKEATSSEAPPKGAAERPKLATRISENYIPDENMRAWFADEQLHRVIDVRTEHAKFVDYFLGAPGEKGRKRDWPATWRNWMRRAAERASGNGRPGGSLVPISVGAPAYRPSTTDQRVAAGLALAAQFREEESK